MSWFQIIVLAAYVFNVIACYTLLLPVVDHLAILLTAILVYTFLIGLTTHAGFKCYTLDPTDSVAIYERDCIVTGAEFKPDSVYQVCIYCKLHVTDSSKHCRLCDRCVEGFDHHCSFVNNCIGYNNYKYFIYLITMLQVLTTVQLAFVGWELAVISANADGDTVVAIYCGFLAVFGVCSLGIWLVNGHLIVYHIWLYYHGMTTYEHVMRQRQARTKKIEFTATKTEHTAPTSDLTVSKTRVHIKPTEQEGNETTQRNDVSCADIVPMREIPKMARRDADFVFTTTSDEDRSSHLSPIKYTPPEDLQSTK